MRKFLRTAHQIIRIVWTMLTYPLAVPAGIVGALIGGVWGLLAGIQHGRGALFGLRSGTQRGVVRAVRIIFGGSTWLYRKLLLHKMDVQDLPAFTRPAQNLLIIGHRGAPYAMVENTLSSFAKALAEGANALEIDICITSDQEVVVWHDWDPDSGTAKYRESGLEDNQKYRPYYPNPPKRRPVSEVTLVELRQSFGYARKDGSAVPPKRLWRDIPTFNEFVRWASRKSLLRTVFLDIKIPKNEVDQVAPMLAGIRAAMEGHSEKFELVILSAFRPVVEEFHRLAPELKICFDQVVVHALPLAAAEASSQFSTVRPAEEFGFEYAAVGRPTTFTLAPFEVYEKIILKDIAYRHDKCLGTKLIAWTINDAKEMSRLIAMGVDGILTDYPYRLARTVDNQEAFDVVRKARRWLGFHPNKNKP